ncbi:MAG TPA: hypothetical protein VLZ83_15375 [Edaphocola sp.]|nr:hypothetical protein [Edaphocola sp.]
MAKLNINTNKIERFGYEHPKTKGKLSNSSFKLLPRNSIFVNAFAFCDLLTICDVQGTLKYNIYGPNWEHKHEKRQSYFGKVDFFGNQIIAAYIGDDAFVYDKYEKLRSNAPSKFLLFDITGNHIKTIETEYSFFNFCIDQENERVICYFNDRDTPLGYFNLNIEENKN